MDWLKANIVAVVTILAIAASLMTQWNNFQSSALQIAELKLRLDRHMSDTSIHIDPRRDDQRWQDLTARLQRIEAKLDAH